MFLAKLSIKRPVLTTMLILVFLIFGGLAYFGLNLNQMPDVEIPFVSIQTIYPGAGPKEIETQVSQEIEDAVATVSEIKRIESYSLDGVSIIIMEFDLTKDVDVANQEVKDKIDQILNELPEDAEEPLVQKVDFKAFPIMDVILSGDLSSQELYDVADKTLKDRFSQIKGVAKVDITGGQEREIKVRFNNKVAYENMISLPQFLQIMNVNNMDIPGGYLQIEDQEYTVRLEGKYQDIDEIRNLRVPTAFGLKRLEQIATVVDTGKKIRQKAIFFDNETKTRDKNVVRIGVVKSPDGNIVNVAERVRKELPGIREVLPEGANVDIVNDRSDFIKSAVNDTMSNILLGVLFTSLILLIFLHDVRSTIIVALSMPTSIISTFLLFQLFDMSLNMMSLMGLSVSVGVLVANSVVVIENIFRHKEMDKSNKKASYQGTREITVAVIAATMTNIAVFLPVAAMSSMVGRFLAELALAASFATIFSLLMSFTLTPMLASLILPEKKKEKGALAGFLERIEKKSETLYQKALGKALQNKFVSLAIIVLSLLLVLASGIYFLPKLGFEFMPPFDEGRIQIITELPTGYNLKETANVMQKIETRLSKREEVEQIITDLGKKSDVDIGANLAIMDVKIIGKQYRDYSTEDEVNRIIKELADVPNAKIKVRSQENIGMGGSPIQMFLLGQDLNKLETLKDTVMKKIEDVPGLINLDNSSRTGKPEITIYPDRKKLADVGITTMELATTLRASIEGIVSSQYKEYGREYDIAVTLNEATVNTPDKIGAITVVGQTGAYRLSELADIEFTSGYTKILHRDQYVAIQFTGSNAPDVPLGNVTEEIQKRIDKIDLPSGYSFKWSGNTEMMYAMIQDMIFALILATILTYMLLAAILESFAQPLYILVTLPLALIGVFLSLYIAGIAMNMVSLMAIVMLIGIVVNNAILILDYANILRREEGKMPKEALLIAGPTKLKPIIMSTVAIILGMLPMALGIGAAGAEMRQALGIVSIGGLIISTSLTIFVIPAFYYVFSLSKSVEKEDIELD